MADLSNYLMGGVPNTIGIAPYINATPSNIDPALLAALLPLLQEAATEQGNTDNRGNALPPQGGPSEPTTEDILLNYLISVGKSGVGGVGNQLVNTGDINLETLGAGLLGAGIGALPMFLGPEGKYLSPLSSGLGNTVSSYLTGLGDPLTAGLGGLASGLVGLGLSELGAPSSFTSGISTMGLPTATINAISNAAGLGSILPALSSTLGTIGGVAGPLVMTGLNIYEDYKEDKAITEAQKDAEAQALIAFHQNKDIIMPLYDQIIGQYLNDYSTEYMPGFQVPVPTAAFPLGGLVDKNGNIIQTIPGIGQVALDPVLYSLISGDPEVYEYEPQPFLNPNTGRYRSFMGSPVFTNYEDPMVIAQGVESMMSGELTPQQIEDIWNSYGLTPEQEQGIFDLGTAKIANVGKPVTAQNISKIEERTGVEVDPFIYTYMMQKNTLDEKEQQILEAEARKKQEAIDSLNYSYTYGGAGGGGGDGGGSE